jgi:hypothetical protein
VDEKDAEAVKLEKAHDLIFLSVGLYQAIMAEDPSGDALLLYLRYFYTARWQETNSVWANKIYLQKVLNWSRERVESAKARLTRMELIAYDQKQGKDGKFCQTYTRLLFPFNPTLSTAARPHRAAADRGTGGPGHRLAKAIALRKDEVLEGERGGDTTSPLLAALQEEARIARYPFNFEEATFRDGLTKALLVCPPEEIVAGWRWALGNEKERAALRFIGDRIGRWIDEARKEKAKNPPKCPECGIPAAFGHAESCPIIAAQKRGA